ncbi:MAG: hypothetical protein IKZ09_03300 [Clostridia bacterium]|nr:hypothetical protein [Clostridia bacterium]
MKNRTPISALGAAALLAAILLASCGGDSGAPAETNPTEGNVTETAAVTEPAAYDSVPELDFGGAELRILQQEQPNYYIDEPEATGDVVVDEIVRSNTALEDRFNFNFNLIERGIGYSQVGSYLRKSVNAGEDAYDLILDQLFDSASLATAGLLRSWTDVPYIDLNQPWYTKSIRDEASVGDQLLMLESDMVLSYTSQTWLMLYNKTDAAAIDLPDLYQTVRDGKWTYDLLYEYAADAYVDLNGNGSKDDDDYYGFASTLGDCLLASAFYAGEGRMVSLSDDLSLSYPIQSEHSINVLGKMASLFNDNPGAIKKADALRGTRMSLFPKGNILFEFMQAGDLLLSQMRDMEDEFGVLPMPKYDESQSEHYTMIDGGADIMTIPATATNLELIGAAVEAGSASSYHGLMPIYMGMAMEQKGTRDEESISMLRYVLDSRVVDFAYLFDGTKGFTFKINGLIKNPEKMVSSLEKNVKSVDKYYISVIEEMTSED